ncbi:DUF1622 domain-containing protein [Synechococcus sp. GFB01]|uniref:DUF1622 domain-containing protein n=1 Tax=Synechococcus sp. GFB01 TaxID=1662190 RepID=UPI00064F0A75|nr:DUF1622 domain-containing protein [Synechococcus sp. GFB01]KMM16965.1 hypothetical protein SYNGFB01_07410 [Synechococcus sp. GFB01]
MTPAVAGPEALEHLFRILVSGLRFSLEVLSVLCVAAGLLAALRLAIPALLQRRRPHRTAASVRLSFGSWLSMALEFQLGADIVATTAAPSGANLLQLAAIALIRTFLNVFLAREIEAERKLEDERPRSVSSS